jgi:hypothetical protein
MFTKKPQVTVEHGVKFLRTVNFCAVLLLLVLAGPAYCATTTVTQTIKNPDDTPASGTALIRISKPCKSGANYVGDQTIRVRFTAGAFSVALVPNDTCSPIGTTYTVSWVLAGGTPRYQTWRVPTSGAAVTVDSVVVPTADTAGLGNLADGSYCMVVAGNIVTSLTSGPCGGGSGPVTLSWSHLTNSTWTSITSSTWATLVP